MTSSPALFPAVTVVRDRKIRTVLRTNQIAGFVTVPSWKKNKYMLLAGWEVRIGKTCDRGLENAARGSRPRAAFSSPRSQFFPIQTDPKAVNNIFIFFFLP